MGHIHLATLPASRKWRTVASLLNEHAAAREVIAASARAAEKDLARAATDPVLASAIRLMALVPKAARGRDFAEGLRELEVVVPEHPMLADISVGVASALERRPHGSTRSDFGEMVRRALVATLTTGIGDALPGQFDSDAEEVRRAAARLARPESFAGVARAFFGRLFADTLGSWLDRKLSVDIGPDAPFRSLTDRDAFDRALEQYCSDATRIIRELSAAWYGRTLEREGTITSERSAAYSALAMNRIGEELRHQRDAVHA